MEEEIGTFVDIFPESIMKKILTVKEDNLINLLEEESCLILITTFKKEVKEEKIYNKINQTKIFLKEITSPITFLLDSNEIYRQIQEYKQIKEMNLKDPAFVINLHMIMMIFKTASLDKHIFYRPCLEKSQDYLFLWEFITVNERLIQENFLNQIIEKQKDKLKRKKRKKNSVRNYLTKSIRYEVFKKDNFKCVLCGKSKNQTNLEIDHIVPISRGGSDELENLQTLCSSCNLSKSNRIYKKIGE